WSRVRAAAPAVMGLFVDDVNRSAPIYRGDEMAFSRKAFLAWCQGRGILWPVKRSPQTGKWYHPLDDHTMEEQEGRHPLIGLVRQAQKTRKHLGKRSIVVDRVTGRHYFDTAPFRAVTGRNQPTGFIFAGPKWMRWLITPESPDHALVSVDYVAQE